MEFALADEHGVVDTSVLHFAQQFPDFADVATPAALLHSARVRGLLLDAARLLGASTLKTCLEAATALGYSKWRVMFRHILPNALQPIIVYGTIAVGGVILSEAALSFLGVGPTDPTPARPLSSQKSRLSQMRRRGSPCQ